MLFAQSEGCAQLSLEEISLVPAVVSVTVIIERMLGAALPRIESHELILRVAEEQWMTQI